MKEYTEAQKQLVLESLSKNKGSVIRTAKHLGMTPAEVRLIDIVANGKFNYTPEGRGRLELQPYIIAVRDRNETATWDNTDPKIIKAREYYDQGLVELTTGVDGMNLILYAIPREKKKERETYFEEGNHNDY